MVTSSKNLTKMFSTNENLAPNDLAIGAPTITATDTAKTATSI
jgi:hypothetical protein